MFTSKQVLGNRGEGIAEMVLRRRGYAIVTRNFRTREGEIDLIARDGKTLVFVEVKTRSSDRFGAPEEAVTQQKLARMRSAAFAFLVEHPARAIRFDVIAIDAWHNPPHVRHLRSVG